MTLLREYIKELIREAAKGPESLGNMKVYLSRDDGDIEIWIADPKEVDYWKNNSSKNLGMTSIMNRASIGILSAVKSDEADCLGGYEISWAHVDDEAKGFGPMLYDIAMETATAEGSGLLPDRRNISSDAYSIWNYYATRRPDVIAIQLDDLSGRLTPETKGDDCPQWLSYDHQDQDSFWDEDNEETPWDPYGKDILLHSPLSKLYKSTGSPTLDALSSVDRLVKL